MPPGCTAWYLVITSYDASGNTLSQSWNYMYTECPEGTPTGSENTAINPVSQPPDYTCFDQELSNFNSEVAGGYTTSENLGFTVTDINSITKSMNFSWICFHGFGGWKLISHETGVVKLIDASTRLWAWVSLVHGKITKEGSTFPGVHVENTDGTGTASFTPEDAARHNIFSAGMSINFSITYTLVCDCLLTKFIVTPYSKNYPAHVIFSSATPTND